MSVGVSTTQTNQLATSASKGLKMANSKVIEQNQQTAMAFVRRLVGGDLLAYFQSEQAIASVRAECGHNTEIQRLTTNYVWGSFERAEHNKQALESKLREMFQLPA